MGMIYILNSEKMVKLGKRKKKEANIIKKINKKHLRIL